MAQPHVDSAPLEHNVATEPDRAVPVRARNARPFAADGPLRLRLDDRACRRWFRSASERIATEDTPHAETQSATRTFLRRHLPDRGAGLSDLPRRIPGRVWPGFTGDNLR